MNFISTSQKEFVESNFPKNGTVSCDENALSLAIQGDVQSPIQAPGLGLYQ